MPDDTIMKKQEYAGYFMEYPAYADVQCFIRDLSWDEQFSVLSQGFHRGASEVRCYSMEEFVFALGKREFDNPAGGVRSIDYEGLVRWVGDVIGDAELAGAIEKIWRNCPEEAEAIDTLRVVVFIRMNQYNEVIKNTGDAWHGGKPARQAFFVQVRACFAQLAPERLQRRAGVCIIKMRPRDKHKQRGRGC